MSIENDSTIESTRVIDEHPCPSCGGRTSPHEETVMWFRQPPQVRYRFRCMDPGCGASVPVGVDGPRGDQVQRHDTPAVPQQGGVRNEALWEAVEHLMKQRALTRREALDILHLIASEIGIELHPAALLVVALATESLAVTERPTS